MTDVSPTSPPAGAPPATTEARWVGLARSGLYVHAAFLPISIAGMQLGLGLTVLALIALRLRGRTVWARSELDLPALLFCGVAVLSLIVAGGPNDGLRNAVLWRTFLAPLVLLSALELAPDRTTARRDALRLLVIWAVAALAPSVLAWVQHHRPLDLLHELGLRAKPIVAAAPLHPGRWAATGFFTWYQRLAHNLTPPLCVLAAVLALGGLGGRVRAIGAAIALAVTSAVVLSFARSAWYGLVAAAGVLVLLAGRRIAVPAAIASVTGAAAVVAMHAGIRARLSSTFDADVNSDRLKIWDICARVVAEHPWTGVGFGNLPEVAAPLYWQLFPKSSVRAWCHNAFYSAWAEGGPLLALALVAFFALTARAFWRIRRSSDALGRAAAVGALAALAAILVNAQAHDVVYASESMYGLAFGLGLAMALARSGRPEGVT